MPSSSLLLGSCTTLVFVLGLFSAFVSAVAGQSYVYSLQKEYSGSSFFDGWDFYSGLDPSKGFVNYVDREEATGSGLARFSSEGDAIMAVDSKNYYDAGLPYRENDGLGRPSVRIMTQQSFYHGLVIADIKHMPYGCGTWPAFWALGANGNWPNSGEIDIIEGVNNRQNALAALHTGGQCRIAGDSRTMTGALQNADCFYDVTTGQGAVGCAILDTDTRSYGRGLNNAGGAVFAMQWTSEAIRIWSFPRQNVPADITSGSPNPSGWGLPAQTFNGPDCDIDNVIKPQKFIFNIDFCGDFGEAVWQSEGCAASTGYDTCAPYVAENPRAFADAYWQVGSLKYFVQVAEGTTTTTKTSSTTTSSTVLTTTTTSSVVETSLTTISITTSSTTTTSDLISVSPILITTAIETQTVMSSSLSSGSSMTLSSVITSVSPILTLPTSVSSSAAPLPTLPITVSPIISSIGSIGPSSVTSYTISPVITSSSKYIWSNWMEPGELTSGKPEGSFFLPPMGSGVPITAGWDAPRPGSEWKGWSPVTANKPTASVDISTWVEWHKKVITITKTWIEPCETGYTTKTTIVVTKHCGCTETPVPTIPMKVITTTCPEEWGFKTPVVVTVPDIAVATPPARPAKPTEKANTAENWPVWRPDEEATAEKTATWISWGPDNKVPADDAVTWKSWNSNSNNPKTPAANTATWASWSADSDNKDEGKKTYKPVAPAASTAAWASWSSGSGYEEDKNENNNHKMPEPTTAVQTGWSAVSSVPAESSSSSTPSQLWANYPGTAVPSGRVAIFTGAATKTSIATGVLGFAVMVAAFVL